MGATTSSSVAIIVGVATLVITLIAILSTVAGYRLVRRYVTEEFRRSAEAAFDLHGRPMLDEKFDRVLEEWDEQLTTLLIQFRKSTGASGS